MLNDIYNKRIIELAGNIPRLGRLPDPHASATAHSKLCGSTVKVDLKMEGPVVTDFAHDVKETVRRQRANGPTSPCSNPCATTRRAMPRPC
jgi:hypothetical protein